MLQEKAKLIDRPGQYGDIRFAPLGSSTDSRRYLIDKTTCQKLGLLETFGRNIKCIYEQGQKFKAILASDCYHCIACFFLHFPVFYCLQSKVVLRSRSRSYSSLLLTDFSFGSQYIKILPMCFNEMISYVILPESVLQEVQLSVVALELRYARVVHHRPDA